jgi:hypothetical protein
MQKQYNKFGERGRFLRNSRPEMQLDFRNCQSQEPEWGQNSPGPHLIFLIPHYCPFPLHSAELYPPNSCHRREARAHRF